MPILVSDIAKIYGMTKQTLHYYESRGVLKPLRDNTNGYRYYQESDLQKLGTIKKLRNAGFELSVWFDVQQGFSSQQLQSVYRQRRSQVFDTIRSELRVLRQLDEDISDVERYHCEGTKWRQEQLDAMVRYEFFDETLVMVNAEAREEAAPWFENVFFTAASHMIYCDEQNEYSYFSRGLITSAQLAAELGLPPSPNASRLPAGQYATALFRFFDVSNENKNQIFSEVLQSFRQWSQLPLKGRIFTRTVQTFRNSEGSLELYMKAYAPLDCQK